jgi:hypothetical protein
MIKTGVTVSERCAVYRNDESVTGRAHRKLVLRAEAKGFIKLVVSK